MSDLSLGDLITEIKKMDEQYTSAYTWIEDRIAAKKNPHSKLQKELDRINYHAEQLHAAYEELLRLHEYWSNERNKESLLAKTQRRMLDKMSDKVFKLYAVDVLGGDKVGNYIWPDDRQQVTDVLVVALTGKGEVENKVGC